MIGYTVNQAKGLFFDSDKVKSLTDAATRRNLGKSGGEVRKIARRSMRKARMKSRGDMTEREIRVFDLRVAQWKLTKQGPRPKRPLAASKPGEPPRVRRGDIKQQLFYVYDPSSKSVVVGPAKLSRATGAPATLEFGGSTRGSFGKTVTVAKRPYMQPALAVARPKMSELWKNSVRK